MIVNYPNDMRLLIGGTNQAMAGSYSFIVTPVIEFDNSPLADYTINVVLEKSPCA